VARLVLTQTERVLLAGEGARQFARAQGFREENLLTDRARRMWLHWKRKRGPHCDWRPPQAEDAPLELERYFREQFERAAGGVLHGTVHFAALDRRGDLACATTTSGHAFKMPGRVGDSPVVGAGLYVDNEIGTCGSIGRGESNLENLTSFAAVDAMRRGRSPRDAGIDAITQIARKTAAHLCDDEGRPRFDLRLFLLARDGTHAGVCLWGPKQYAVTDAQGTRLVDCKALYGDAP
jgi:N4-(beta-N-acetylglucosaminyl)-L-asparaginase